MIGLIIPKRTKVQRLKDKYGYNHIKLKELLQKNATALFFILIAIQVLFPLYAYLSKEVLRGLDPFYSLFVFLLNIRFRYLEHRIDVKEGR